MEKTPSKNPQVCRGERRDTREHFKLFNSEGQKKGKHLHANDKNFSLARLDAATLDSLKK